MHVYAHCILAASGLPRARCIEKLSEEHIDTQNGCLVEYIIPYLKMSWTPDTINYRFLHHIAQAALLMYAYQVYRDL